MLNHYALFFSKKGIFMFIFSTGHSFTDVEVDAIMNLGDLDQDGEINLEVVDPFHHSLSVYISIWKKLIQK